MESESSHGVVISDEGISLLPLNEHKFSLIWLHGLAGKAVDFED